MSYPRLVAVLANTTSYERENCTPSTLGSLAFIRTLDDKTLMFVAQANPYGDRHDHHFEDVYHALSPKQSMNPSWLTSTAAVEAYERDLIDEYDLDTLMRAM